MSFPYEFKRRYSNRTQNLLFGLSGNRCANPDCNNYIIAEPNQWDDASNLSNIAHIYSVKSTGPRPFTEYAPSESFINGFSNLILLCRHCHVLIDDRINTYDVTCLRQWKDDHLAKNLKTRTSILSGDLSHVYILRIKFRLHVIDAKCSDISPPHTELTNVGSQRVWATTYTFSFEFDNGDTLPIHLTNFSPPCSLGGRVSILLATTENNTIIPYSIYRHDAAYWTKLPNTNPQAVYSIGKNEAKYTKIVLIILFLASTVFQFYKLPFYAMALLAVIFLYLY